MEFAFLGILVVVFSGLITYGNQDKHDIELNLEQFKIYKKGSKIYNLLIKYKIAEFLYKKLILYVTSNILLTGGLLIVTMIYKEQINCISYLLTISLLYIPSFILTVFCYNYFSMLYDLKQLKSDIG